MKQTCSLIITTVTFYRKYETSADQDSKILSHIIGYFDEAIANGCAKAVLLLHATVDPTPSPSKCYGSMLL